MFKKDEVMQPMNVKLPLAIRNEISKRAEKLGTSQSYIVREMIKKSLESA